MKMHSVIVVVLVAGLLLALFTHANDAARRRRKQKDRARRTSGKKTTPKFPKHIYVSPLSCEDGRNCSNRRCQGPDDQGEGSGRVRRRRNREDVVRDAVTTLLESLDRLNHTLGVLGQRSPGADHMNIREMDDAYPGQAVKELNPTTRLRLTSDKKYQVLGQTLWWVNWVRASLTVLEVLDEARNRSSTPGTPLVPTRLDPYTQQDVTLHSALTSVKDLQICLATLWKAVGGQLPAGKGKGKNPLQCQKVKVMPACGKRSLNCSDERKRAYIVLQDSRRAVIRMRRVWEKVGSSVMNGTMRHSVFYGCERNSCDLQKKRCKQCLSWASV